MSRLPIRIEARRGLKMESPHVMVLIDDRNKTVVEPLYQIREQFPKLYETELMFDSGSVSGYRISDKFYIE